MSSDATDTYDSRQYRAIGLIGTAHFLSHLYQLALPPMYGLVIADLKIGYAELGFVMTGYFVATTALQLPAGFLVLRIGGRNVLALGLFINAGSIALAGFTTTYWELLVVMTCAGIGNAVFHPADFHLLSATVAESKLGKVFAMHSITGNAGFAAAPVVLILAGLWDWRMALVIVGTVGVALAVFIMLSGDTLSEGDGAGRKTRKKAAADWRFLLQPRMVLFLLYYTATASTWVGITQFSVVALDDLHGVGEQLAGIALTVFLLASIIGTIAGGFLADWTTRHDLVLVAAFFTASVLASFIGAGIPGFWMSIAALAIVGVMRGSVGPSRDLLVRNASPRDAVAPAFAFVTLGFTIGQSITPPIYGWIVDNNSTAAAFYVSAAFGLVAIFIVLVSKERRL